MLSTYQQHQLRRVESELQSSDPWLAKALAAHRWYRRPLRQRLAAAAERALAAWMQAVSQMHDPWLGHRWL